MRRSKSVDPPLFDAREDEFKGTCTYCNKSGWVQPCFGCRQVQYCSKDCRIADSRNHRNGCVRAHRTFRRVSPQGGVRRDEQPHAAVTNFATRAARNDANSPPPRHESPRRNAAVPASKSKHARNISPWKAILPPTPSHSRVNIDTADPSAKLEDVASVHATTQPSSTSPQPTRASGDRTVTYSVAAATSMVVKKNNVLSTSISRPFHALYRRVYLHSISLRDLTTLLVDAFRPRQHENHISGGHDSMILRPDPFAPRGMEFARWVELALQQDLLPLAVDGKVANEIAAQGLGSGLVGVPLEASEAKERYAGDERMGLQLRILGGQVIGYVLGGKALEERTWAELLLWEDWEDAAFEWSSVFKHF